MITSPGDDDSAPVEVMGLGDDDSDFPLDVWVGPDE